MAFDPDTMVAQAIEADPGVVDRLVALDPVFGKLRNPVLRKVMGRLVSFRDAARVAGVPLARVMAVVNGTAGDVPAAARCDDGAARPEPAPDWLARPAPANAAALDVRPLLDAGEEPMGPVLRAAARVAEGGYLVLQAPFDPAPLRRVLSKKGFVSHGRRVADGHWEIVLLRDAVRAAAAIPADGAVSDPHGARSWRAGAETHIDVRGLAPPQPMLSIIALIEGPAADGPVIVHHEREPVFLYPELAERGWRHEIIEGDAGEVRLRLSREAGS